MSQKIRLLRFLGRQHDFCVSDAIHDLCQLHVVFLITLRFLDDGLGLKIGWDWTHVLFLLG